MTMKRVLVAAVAVAIVGSPGVLAQQATRPSTVVPGEVILVKPAQPYQYRGFAVTEKDAALLNEAVAALNAMPDMNGALVVIVANNGRLSVNGLTRTVDQASRIEMKLKSINGGTKVVGFFDNWNSGV